ncbi:MAG TPA: hypothetical protein VGS07_09580 [Thermoanaerobaculia bacterium]|jgi:hypothetical protein|nr:hypothetical protein [Thermoanaerobaculia bacterium]
MKAARKILLGCPIILSILPAPAPSTAGLAVTARQALEGDARAVKTLRAAGPAGMETLLKLADSEPALVSSPAFNAALDAVCAQKDCAASHLYWYTDLEAARAAAKLSGRPILSLRLLGRLDEELSCANSRFFRTVLYANVSVSQALRERFVLHWQSERPVPKVTIDFGDGRRMVGTVTGNSIHYILDSNGRLVDALPGLYGPAAFLRHLNDAGDEARALTSVSGEVFTQGLKAYHVERLGIQARELAADLRQPGLEAPMAEGDWKVFVPPVLAASELTASKSSVEVPLLKALLPAPVEVSGERLAALAGLHMADARLDAASRLLLLAKGGAWVKGDLGAIDRFEELIAADTVRNEYLFHNQIHTWLARTAEAPDLKKFDERVYSQLFLTPASDPWLGLGPTELFSVLTPVG